ncbi:MAG: hypothetical protein AUG91_06645 [Actinobacteria bacterium 13_1_20CM_4_69_9]|nr:MAG: hypothetical protein AUG91_06645 [Actinobacteria bacterium 13_1_20CM_4_69_9]
MARYEGKRGLVLGVANRRSIAWAIAKRLADGGAQLAFTYQGERIEKSVRELAESVSSPHVTACDVRSDEDVARVFDEVGTAFDGQLDLLVHSVAFAAADDLEGRFTDTPRDRFWLALDVSAYSLVACARAAEPLMEAAGGGAVTLSARSIAGFPTMEAIVEERSPLHRHIESDDVGAAAEYLLSDDAKNVTGTTLYVDSGYHAMGM